MYFLLNPQFKIGQLHLLNSCNFNFNQSTGFNCDTFYVVSEYTEKHDVQQM